MASALQSLMNGQLKSVNTNKKATLIGDPVVESAIVLMALKSRCTEKEFVALATEAALEMEIHQLVDCEQTVMEAVEDTDNTNALRPEAQLAVIELAKKNQDQDYIEYVKHITLAQSYLASLTEKYSEQATSEADEIVDKAADNAKNIPTDEGKEIASKLSGDEDDEDLDETDEEE